jgi:hypothetical protein
MSDQLVKTKNSVERIQQFDSKTLARREELGAALSFESSVEPGHRLVGLMRKMPLNVIEDFPDGILVNLQKTADTVFNIFQEILTFNPAQANPQELRNGLSSRLKDVYAPTFERLYPLISYATSKNTDFSELENRGRAAIQGILDETGTTVKELSQLKNDAVALMDEVQKVAAEQGVSQQAAYFQQEAEHHSEKAQKWKNATIAFGILIALYGVTILFVKPPLIAGTSEWYSALQLIVSKLILFFVFVYGLTLSAKNFLSHQHNEVINRHRQKALQTFRILTDAAGKKDAQDIILTHASACIFAPQETGYLRNSQASNSAPSALNLLSTARLASQATHP